MKEFSVSFYKKLIIFVLALIFIAAVSFFGLAIKAYLDHRDADVPLNYKNTETDGEHISSGDDIKKLAEKAEKKKKELQSADDADKTQKKTDNGEDNFYIEPEKVVYLTFDDGASVNTEEILSILEENSINATFFFNVNEKKSSDYIVRKAFEQGNEIGVATSSRAPLSAVYDSSEDYGRDVDRSIARIEQITGKRPEILRFPGGSNNAYIGSRKDEFINEVQSRGLTYFDWNLCAEGNGYIKDLNSLVANATRIKPETNRYIVLMHDNGNANTCNALRSVIEFYKNEGFVFMPLSSSVKPIVF